MKQYQDALKEFKDFLVQNTQDYKEVAANMGVYAQQLYNVKRGAQVYSLRFLLRWAKSINLEYNQIEKYLKKIYLNACG